MCDDIVARLRSGGARCAWGGDFAWCPSDECDECDLARAAADELEALRAVIEEWVVASVDVGLTATGTTRKLSRYRKASKALKQAILSD